MRSLYRRFLSKGRHFSHRIYSKFGFIKLTLLSLFYNDFADRYYIGDSLMEPMFWFVDHFTKILGPVCVTAVIILSASLIIIAYVIGLPFYLKQNFYILSLALFLGHWLLVNVVFYYYMAYTTDPGYPPQGSMISEAVSICKRCIAPKPPRTHHCVVCNRCILKMDHHCPWLNNCIGHFNHRYFFMFCAYTWIGIVFVIIFGIPLAYDHFYGTSEYKSFSPALLNFMKSVTRHIIFKPRLFSQEEIQIGFNNSTSEINKWPETLYHSCIVYAALLCVAVLSVLGALLAWHARLISRGETSIEGHINKRETERLKKEGQIYKNPYDFGPSKNWKLFLCVGIHRPWWHLLIPFADAPIGDGMQWNMYSNIEWDSTKVKRNLKTCFVKIS